MKLVPGTDVYVPDSDEHFSSLTPKQLANYQLDRLDAADPHVYRRGVAVDGGAHVGLMTRHLAKRFTKVFAFEPNPATFACLVENTKGLRNVVCRQEAIGESSGEVCIDPSSLPNSGNRQILPDGNPNVRVTALDDLGDELELLGLVKLDIQGYEYYALRGAETALRTWRPVLVVEEEGSGKLKNTYGLRRDAARRLLLKAGAELKATLGADNVFAFPKMAAAEEYDKYRESGAYHWFKYERSAGFKGMVDRVVDLTLAGDPPPKTILDVGCGDGLWASLLARDGARVTGFDLSAPGVDEAKRRGLNCLLADVYAVDERVLGAGRFDLVTMFDVLEHLPDQELAVSVLGEFTDRIVILNPHPKGARFHTREFTAGELEQFMAGLGWGQVRREDFQKSSRDRRTFAEFKKAGKSWHEFEKGVG